MRHCHRIVRLITHPALARFGVYFHDQLNAVSPRRPVTELQHFRELIGSVDMQKGEWDFPEESFERQPKEHVRILPHRPWHGQVLKGMVCLAENEDAMILQR